MRNLPYIYACLLDVLGYREWLERDRLQGSFEFKELLEQALSCLNSINDAEYSYQAISDTIILTCSEKARLIPFFEVVRGVQLSFLKSGLLLRGGISYGQHFRSGAITYSPAYAAAHESESRLAIYPRVVIDENILQMFEGDNFLDEIQGSGLLCRRNGVYFINILTQQNWTEVYEMAKGIYEKDSEQLLKKEPVFAKHAWLEEYLFSSPFVVAEAVRYTQKFEFIDRENEL